jgi:hypothetical protein
MTLLAELRQNVSQIANKEFYRLCRLARRAEKRNVSPKVVQAILEEAWEMRCCECNPDRLLRWQAEYELKYAFKAIQ